MIVVDASCLVEVLIGSPGGNEIRRRLSREPDQAAPHIVDVEAFSVIRQRYRAKSLDRTAATQAIEDLQSWPGERFGHQLLLARAWELRDTVRGWDAMYVALAEVLEATLLTTDLRLASAPGPRCRIQTFERSG